ncbi:divalent-cation tolerance protein CutA [Hansschlegelia beijingensis]|uniref:Periplasmic divalent cation tolerance protein n=1 Tax=Hansschlegelia beijingensis TaxID=1133344 RepID=A0A7W6D1Y7_9HYPH|nr:divalent-cation tolerance protein CutA [Hansschlegelia beijingensis]MBB3973136.1 periplasmic divalent cation tolerance protein [Hansschlegelia beijingensis]
MPDFVIVTTTTDDRAVADAIAQAAVEGGEAACARIGSAESVYRWQGELCRTPEFVVELKTTSAAAERVRRTIARLHNYELPEILVLPVLGGSAGYLGWLRDQVAPVESGGSGDPGTESSIG